MTFTFTDEYLVICAMLYICRFEISGKVDISDLTWEQREKVLRFLFAKMNGSSHCEGGRRNKTAHPALEGMQPHKFSSMPSLREKDAWSVAPLLVAVPVFGDTPPYNLTL